MYSLGLWKFHVGWVLLPLSLGAYIKYRKVLEKRRRRRPPPAKVSDLPRWVFFPDTERVEWINRVLRQLWPKAREMVDQELRWEIRSTMLMRSNVKKCWRIFLRRATRRGNVLEGYTFQKVRKMSLFIYVP